jgi:uroporphyrinogen decarboxylase
LREVQPAQGLSYVLEAIRFTRARLAGRVPLIGFAGAPWTLLSYMVEGETSKTFSRAKRFLLEHPAAAHELLGRLARAVGSFLAAQVQAGAEALQIFDSWAGALGPRDFHEFVLPYLVETVRVAREAGTSAPIIVFAPGAGWALEQIAAATAPDVMGIDWQTDAAEARRRLAGYPVALQGNFEPSWLYAEPKVIRERTREMLAAFGPRGYIANLGHGILPDVPVAHARAFVEAVKEWQPA